ncbi:hypothetical protein KIW84_055893 [Lathyrus oleraceus]|uniref:Uncharacterized protein n=1 Tax=Pisum sativum TaxID=3888 RepID=A0A9D5ALW3_PEA|nr:hypothetical protein KIW84_055893 [Pisum sativum]
MKETTYEWELLNDVKAVWLRSPKEVTEEEYTKFYNSLAKDFSGDKPLSWSHFTAEGDVKFKAVLYASPKAPQDLYESYHNSNKSNLKLKALDMIRKLAEEDPDESTDKEKKGESSSEIDEKRGQYTKFWNEFGKSIKLGIMEDATNRSVGITVRATAAEADMLNQSSFIPKDIGNLLKLEKLLFHVNNLTGSLQDNASGISLPSEPARSVSLDLSEAPATSAAFNMIQSCNNLQESVSTIPNRIWPIADLTHPAAASPQNPAFQIIIGQPAGYFNAKYIPIQSKLKPTHHEATKIQGRIIKPSFRC